MLSINARNHGVELDEIRGRWKGKEWSLWAAQFEKLTLQEIHGQVKFINTAQNVAGASESEPNRLRHIGPVKYQDPCY